MKLKRKIIIVRTELIDEYRSKNIAYIGKLYKFYTRDN